jgi:hypothetical protein
MERLKKLEVKMLEVLVQYLFLTDPDDRSMQRRGNINPRTENPA